MAIAAVEERSGIDPRIFLMAHHDIIEMCKEKQRYFSSSSRPPKEEECSQDEDDSDSDVAPMEDVVVPIPKVVANVGSGDHRLQLPLSMTFRWMWKASDGEQYPVIADLVYVSEHVMLHQIRAHPLFPERFSGKYFSKLSTSALYIKPTEVNGYVAWHFQDSTGAYRKMKDARDMGFRNMYAERPSLQPTAARIVKESLHRMSDMAQTLHPQIAKRGKSAAPKKRRPIAVQPNDAVHETFEDGGGAASSSMQLQPFALAPSVPWTLPNSVKAWLDYAVEVFPGSSKHISIAWSGEQQTLNSMKSADLVSLDHVVAQMPPGMQIAVASQSPFNKLGCVMSWSMAIKGYVDEICIGTDCTNIQQTLANRIRPKEFFLSLGDMLQSFEARKVFRCYPFSINTDGVTIYRQGTAIKTIRINDVVDEVAHARHVEFNIVKWSVIRDTPSLFAVCSSTFDVS